VKLYCGASESPLGCSYDAVRLSIFDFGLVIVGFPTCPFSAKTGALDEGMIDVNVVSL
jgi:hypothetical protein